MSPWWKIGIILAYTLLIAGATWRVAAWKYTAADEKRTIAEQVNTISAENGVIAKERADNLTTNEVSNAYENRISAIDSEYNAIIDGVQPTGITATGSMPAIPGTQPGHNAAACANGISKRNEKAALALAKQADIQTARLVACQAWIKLHQPAH